MGPNIEMFWSHVHRECLVQLVRGKPHSLEYAGLICTMTALETVGVE